MGDAGEGLIDAQARIAEQMEEREQLRRQARDARDTPMDPERRRRAESLRLARVEIERQRATTGHAGRQQQLTQAIDELDRQIAALAANTG